MAAALDISEEFYDIVLAGNALRKQGWRSEPIANPIVDVVLTTVGDHYRRRDHFDPWVHGVIDCVTAQLLLARGPWPMRRQLYVGLSDRSEAKEVAHSLVHSVVRHGNGSDDGTNLWEIVRAEVLVGLGALLRCQSYARYKPLASSGDSMDKSISMNRDCKSQPAKSIEAIDDDAQSKQCLSPSKPSLESGGGDS